MEGAVRVRRADAGDVPALAELRWAWAWEWGRPRRSLEEFEPDLAAWVDETRHSHVPFLAVRDGYGVGMAWLGVIRRLPDVDRPLRRAGLVQSVYVRAEHRNGRVGEALVHAVVGHARGLGLDYLEVHPSERSVAFYRRAGFVSSQRTLELRLGGGR